MKRPILTENELVAALRRVVEGPPAKRGSASRSIIIGIGDDAAVWQPSRSHFSVVTSDMLVDGVHFLSKSMPPEAVGHRALAANLSDIAAMGARPVLATVALGVAPATTPEWILACYRGMAALAATHVTCIAGGDIVRAPATMLALTVVGEVAGSRLKQRGDGRPRDVLATTGPLGLARAGLELLRRPTLRVADHVREAAAAAFATPAPRVREGRWLAASRHVHAMIDISDGLSTDLARLAAASGCGATLKLPQLHPAVAGIAAAADDADADDVSSGTGPAGGAPPLERTVGPGGRATPGGSTAEHFVLDGGEDFELLVSIAPRAFPYLAQRFQVRFGRALIALGTLDLERGIRLPSDGGMRDLVPGGYDHLRDLRLRKPGAPADRGA